MIIANPIYDVVFKYLMENLEIARGIISTIIGETIVHIDFKSRENIYRNTAKHLLAVYHLDFIARIQQDDGHLKTVLIELQKSEIPFDVCRFRRYLGDQYRREDDVKDQDGKPIKKSLPLLTIYFLGFRLFPDLPAVVKVNRQYIDILEDRVIKTRNNFIESLTHDSFFIQIPALKLSMKTPLERLLSIFKQENFIAQDKHLKNYQYQPQDSLMEIVLKRLMDAAGDKKILRRLELEEMAQSEYESTFGELQKELSKKDKALEEKDQALAQKELEIKELLAKLAQRS